MNQDRITFSTLVRPELILDKLHAVNREDALHQMARILVEAGYCRPTFVEAILERERNHPSALPMPGHKIAIPHTDSEHVERSTILFARLEQPVEFFSMGDPGEVLQVQMISMLALKEKKRIGDLLETFINVYQHNEILDEIINAADTETIYHILQKSVEKYGKEV